MAEKGRDGRAELAAAKKYIVGAYAINNLDIPRSRSPARWSVCRLDGLGIDYIERRVDLINSVTLDQVQAAARKLLSAEPAMHGDRAGAHGREQGVNDRRCGRPRAARAELRRSVRRRRRARPCPYPRHRGARRARHQAGGDRRLVDRRHHGRRHGGRHERQATSTTTPARCCRRRAEVASRMWQRAAGQHRRDGRGRLRGSASSTSSAS